MRGRLLGLPSTVFVISTLASCSIIGGRDSSNQMAMEVRNSVSASMDPEIERSSEGLHQYLVGQMLYSAENYKEATKRFSRAAELIDQPAPGLHMRLAELNLRNGDLTKALEESERAVAEDSQNPSVLLLHAGILDAMDRSSDAIPLYNGIISEFPERNEAYILLAGVYIKTKEFEKSVEVLTRLLKRAPYEPITHYFLARSYESMGNISLAKKEISEAYILEPENPNFGVSLVRLLVKDKSYLEAQRVCREILERDPKNVGVRRVLGQLLLGESKYDEALEHLRILGEEEEDSTDTRFKIALIEIEKQNFAEAERELSIVLAKSPDHGPARYYLGSVYAATGRKKEAVTQLFNIQPGNDLFIKSRTFAAFVTQQDGDIDGAERPIREALAVDKNNRQILTYLVSILKDGGKLKEAEDIIKSALAREPKDERLLFDYATVLHDQNRENDARGVIRQLLVVNPHQADALNYLAYSLAEEGIELAEAENLIRRALEIKPNDGYYLDTLGWILFRIGKYSEAEDILLRAVEIAGNDPVILEHLGDAQLKNHKPEKARESYQRALNRYQVEGENNKGESKISKDDKETVDKLENKLKSLPPAQPITSKPQKRT